MTDGSTDGLTDSAALAHELDRVADRLRVIGPRYAARNTPEAAAALDGVRAAIQRLADLAADAEGIAHRPVPRLAPHALADQVLVLGHDLLAAACSKAEEPGEEPTAERPTPEQPALSAGHALLVELRRAL